MLSGQITILSCQDSMSLVSCTCSFKRQDAETSIAFCLVLGRYHILIDSVDDILPWARQKNQLLTFSRSFMKILNKMRENIVQANIPFGTFFFINIAKCLANLSNRLERWKDWNHLKHNWWKMFCWCCGIPVTSSLRSPWRKMESLGICWQEKPHVASLSNTFIISIFWWSTGDVEELLPNEMLCRFLTGL